MPKSAVTFFYAVRRGKAPGVYNTWADCQEQTFGCPGSIYKKFTTEEAALAFVQDGDGPKVISSFKDSGKTPKHNGFFYAVRKGLKPGVYDTWPECQEQIKGVHAVYKKFQSKEEALAFVQDTSTVGTKRQFSTSASAEGSKKAKVDKVDGDFTGSPFSDNDGTHVYTDGGCFNNGKKGAQAGVGVFWGKNDPDNVSESLSGRQTNNRAEIHAAICAVKGAKKKGIENLVLHTDSQFLINGITSWIKKWKKNGWVLSTGNPVINKEDFEELDSAVQGINIKWVYVKGHSGDPGNEAVDLLAKSGAAKACNH